MALIDVAILGFLLSEPSPTGIQDAQLPAPQAARLLYSHEPLIPSDDEAKEPTPEPAQQEVTDKDFKVFYLQDLEDAPSTSLLHLHPTQVSTNQKAANIPKGMGFEEKTPNLLALLTAHVGGFSPTVAVVPRPPILAPMRASSDDAADKKWKRAQGGKGIKGAEEGEFTQSSHPPLAKKARTGKGQQNKTTSSRTSKELAGDQPKKPSAWRSIFNLSPGNLVLDNANLRDSQKGNLGLVSKCLEKTLCLPEDMVELRSFRKREVFVALKQDLAKVYYYSH